MGSTTTESEKPKPPASASIEVAYARAPSGASSTTATAATVAVVMRNARWNTCAPVRNARLGESAETPHAIADPTTPIRIELRRPRRSASAIPSNAMSAPMRVIARAMLSDVSEASKVCLIGPPNWPTSALANATTATAAAAVARCVACASVNGAVGRPTTGCGGGGGACAVEPGLQPVDRVPGGAALGDGDERAERPAEERDADPADRFDPHERGAVAGARRVEQDRNVGEAVIGDGHPHPTVVESARVEAGERSRAHHVGRRREPDRQASAHARHATGTTRKRYTWPSLKLVTERRRSR